MLSKSPYNHRWLLPGHLPTPADGMDAKHWPSGRNPSPAQKTEAVPPNGSLCI